MTPKGPAPEAGCNCEHLDDSATCHWCSIRQPSRGPTLMTDGGQPSTTGEQTVPRRSETDGTVSPSAVSALIKRVDALEDRLESQQQTITDLVAMVNRAEGKVEDLDDRVDSVVFVDDEGADQ